jgi:predicted RND superfamily exporter protein
MSTRFLQLRKDYPAKNNFEIISLTTNKMFWPILYTVFTTVFAFLSLIFSGIKPIIDFGWMMTFGLITSFIITFTLLPTLLNFAPTKNITLKKEQDSKITTFLGNLSLNNKNKKGKIVKNKFFKKISEIILMLVSEKMIINKPIMKVKILTLE